jgi:hypothetical protein
MQPQLRPEETSEDQKKPAETNMRPTETKRLTGTMQPKPQLRAEETMQWRPEETSRDQLRPTKETNRDHATKTKSDQKRPEDHNNFCAHLIVS